MKQILYVLGLVFGVGEVLAQPGIEWQKCLGGVDNEIAYSTYQTLDGGSIIAGYTFSINSGNVIGGYGGGDFWILKTDSLANIEWQKTLGGSSTEVAYAVIQSPDGGYLVAGDTYSDDGEVIGQHGELDAWVIKLDHLGEIVWKRTLGGSEDDGASAVCLAKDGGYLIAGKTRSTDGDALSQGHGPSYDVWIVKLSEAGEIKWEKKYGGSVGEEAYNIVPTTDSGYVFAGVTSSNDGDVYGNHGNDDYWVVKLDSVGTIIWQKPLGGIGADGARDIQLTSDGGYVVVGGAGSVNTGQVSGGKGLMDFWVVKLNNLGNLEWQKTLGGSKVDFGISIIQTENNGFIAAGVSLSLDGDVQGNIYPGIAGWVVQLNQFGVLQWQRAMGGVDIDQFFDLQKNLGGGYILVGETKSNDGDVSGNHGNSDYWVVKLSPNSTPTSTPSTHPLTLSPNPAQNTLTIQTPEPGKLDLQIHNLLGQALWHQSLMGSDLGLAQVNISLLPRGLYLVSVTGASGRVYSGRFLKE